MASHAAAERQILADQLLAVGPDAPTLCEGWTARDLAAHVVSREARFDAGPGIMIPAFAGWTDRVRSSYARRDFTELVERFRTGPPRFGPFGLPGLDARVNLNEYFIHTEDVRRAQSGWQPRELPADRERALWGLAKQGARLFLRKAPVQVSLVEPGGDRVSAGKGEQAVEVHGPPGELVLFSSGRGEHALVRFEGPPEAVQQLKQLKLGF